MKSTIRVLRQSATLCLLTGSDDPTRCHFCKNFWCIRQGKDASWKVPWMDEPGTWGGGYTVNPGLGTRPGKRLHNYGKSPFLMGKSTINGHFQ